MMKSVLVLFGAAFLLAAPFSVRGASAMPAFQWLEGTHESAALGEVLIGELNCIACHKPGGESERWNARLAPDLREAGARITPHYIEKFLSNPQAVKPGAAMPDVLHGMDTEERRETVDALTHFLVAHSGPIAPSKLSGSEPLVERGRQLFHTVGCVACHGPEKGAAATHPVLPFRQLASKTTVDQMAAFLLDPLQSHPSGRMPSFGLAPDEARALAVYLLRDQLKNPQAAEAGAGRSPGIQWEYYELAEPLSRLPDFAKLEPVRSGTMPAFTLQIPGKRSSDYALRFTGLITVPETGRYRFATRSDDGSRLFINGKLVVDNDGEHAAETKAGSTDLSAGDHEIEVTFFQKGGEETLTVHWSGPGIAGQNQEIPAEVLWNIAGTPMVPLELAPFTVDLARAARGRALFSTLGCMACHNTLDGVREAPTAKRLAELDPDAAEGCLSARPGRSHPAYTLTRKQRDTMKAALRNQAKWGESLASDQIVTRSLASLNCYACHSRHELGGPDAAREEFFLSRPGVDLGEEGKIPPALTGVGDKLRPEVLARIIHSGDFHVRDYMVTRMPAFRPDLASHLAGHLVQADRVQTPGEEPPFSEAAWRAGHQLAGIKGVSCIACHNVAGQAGPGIPGIDLAHVYERLNPDWFIRFVSNPGAFKKETRMPQFWIEGETIFPELAGGDPVGQISSLWSYFSLQKSMPLPEGIQPVGSIGMELVPGTEPIVHRTFMAEVGPRAILAGFPEKLHVAFDANGVRLAQAWRGRFFDASGTASGRTDRFAGPLGEDLFTMAEGPAFALLESRQSLWPRPARTDRNAGGRFQGYYLDEQRRPVFRYALGGAEIYEQPIPVIRPGGSILSRHFRVENTGSESGALYHLAAAGQEIEQISPNSFRIDGRQVIALRSNIALQALIRDGRDRKELIVPIPAGNQPITFEALIQW